MGRWFWQGYAALCAVLLGLAMTSEPIGAGVYVVLGLACPAAVYYALRRRRLETETVFRLLLIASVAWGVAIMVDAAAVFGLVQGVHGHDAHDPATSGAPWYVHLLDLLHFIGHPFAAAAAVGIARARSTGQDRAEIVDALLLTATAGLVMWISLVHPVLAAGGSWHRVAAGLAYPVVDFVLIAGCSRVVVQPDVRHPSLRYVALAGALMVVADSLTAVADAGAARSLVYMVSMMLFVAAMLHPSVRTLAAPSSWPVSPFSWGRFSIVATACAVTPVLMLMVLGTRGISTEGWAFSAGATVVGVLLTARVVITVNQLEEQSLRWRMLARTDHLTGLASRRTAETELARAAAASRASGKPLTVALLDFDQFKDYNDTHGHQAGDQLLASAAVVWSSRLAADETLARYGGEEFLLLSPRSPSSLVHLTDQLRRITPAGQSFSAGVAGWTRSEGITEFIGRVEAALQTAKESGRRCTVVSAPPAHGPRRGGPAHPPGPVPAVPTTSLAAASPHEVPGPVAGPDAPVPTPVMPHRPLSTRPLPPQRGAAIAGAPSEDGT